MFDHNESALRLREAYSELVEQQKFKDDDQSNVNL